MTSCSVRHSDFRAVGTDDDAGSIVPRVEVARTRFECGCQVMSLDVEHLADPRKPLLDRDQSDPIWSSIRRTLRIFPSPRHGNRRSVMAGIVRQEIERHGLELLEAAGITRVVDRRLENHLAMIPAGSGHTDDIYDFETGWSPPRRHDGHVSSRISIRRLGRAAVLGVAIMAGLLALTKIESVLASAGLALATALPFVRIGRRSARNESRPTPVFGSERVRVGRGWIETSSGRRRRSEQVLTTVMKESETCDRIEVRIIGATRVIRLRFESVVDPRFVGFWRRWAGYRSEANSHRVEPPLG